MMPVHNLSFILRNHPESVTQIGPRQRSRATPALSINRFRGATMPALPNTPGIYLAQDYTDPLIVNARLVNLAAEIDRNLAARKALRPMRSDAAKRGWVARNGR